jgi:hypothetical protein
VAIPVNLPIFTYKYLQSRLKLTSFLKIKVLDVAESFCNFLPQNNPVSEAALGLENAHKMVSA